MTKAPFLLESGFIPMVRDAVRLLRQTKSLPVLLGLCFSFGALSGCSSVLERWKWGVYTDGGFERMKQGNYRDAEQFLVAALRKAETFLEPLDVAKSHQNLGAFYLEIRDGKAETHYRQAIELYQKVVPPDDPALGTSLAGLGHFYYRQGRYEEAAPLFQQALPIMEKALGSENARVVETRAALEKARKGP